MLKIQWFVRNTVLTKIRWLKNTNLPISTFRENAQIRLNFRKYLKCSKISRFKISEFLLFVSSADSVPPWNIFISFQFKWFCKLKWAFIPHILCCQCICHSYFVYTSSVAHLLFPAIIISNRWLIFDTNMCDSILFCINEKQFKKKNIFHFYHIFIYRL